MGSKRREYEIFSHDGSPQLRQYWIGQQMQVGGRRIDVNRYPGVGFPKFGLIVPLSVVPHPACGSPCLETLLFPNTDLVLNDEEP